MIKRLFLRAILSFLAIFAVSCGTVGRITTREIAEAQNVGESLLRSDYARTTVLPETISAPPPFAVLVHADEVRFILQLESEQEKVLQQQRELHDWLNLLATASNEQATFQLVSIAQGTESDPQASNWQLQPSMMMIEVRMPLSATQNSLFPSILALEAVLQKAGLPANAQISLVSISTTVKDIEAYRQQIIGKYRAAVANSGVSTQIQAKIEQKLILSRVEQAKIDDVTNVLFINLEQESRSD